MKIKGWGSVSVGFCEDFGHRIGRGFTSRGPQRASCGVVFVGALAAGVDSAAFWAGGVTAAAGRRVVEEPSGR